MTAKANNDDDRARPSEAPVQGQEVQSREQGDAFQRIPDNIKPFSDQEEQQQANFKEKFYEGYHEIVYNVGLGADNNLYAYEYNPETRKESAYRMDTRDEVAYGSPTELATSQHPQRCVGKVDLDNPNPTYDPLIEQHLEYHLKHVDIYKQD